MDPLTEAQAARAELHRSSYWPKSAGTGNHLDLTDKHLGNTITALTPLPPPVAESPDKTIVPPAQQIVDKAGHVWTITAAKQVAINGKADPVTGAVEQLDYVGGRIYQRNTPGDWYVTDAVSPPVWSLWSTGDPLAPTQPPVPTGKVRFGISENTSGGGSKQAVLDLGVKIIREDTGASNAWAKQNGIDVIQIVPVGGTGAVDGTAYAYECGGNEPQQAGVDPKVWAPKTLADMKTIKARFPNAKVIVTLCAIGAYYGNNGQDDKGNYWYPNGSGISAPASPQPWVDQIEAAAPGILKLADGFSVHPYFNNPPFRVLDIVRKQLTAHGATGQFWITESGQYDNGDAASEQTAAAAIKTQAAAAAARTDTHCYILYRLGEALEGNAHWGIVRADGSKKPAYAVYKATVAA